MGGLSDVRVDVRVIAATNRSLEQEVRAGKFREDLLYRLQVMPIPLPPLRERHGDIPLLASFYIDRFNREFRKRVRGFVPAATTLLGRYQWPGNVRELRNAIERAMLLVDRELLESGDFSTLTGSVAPARFQLSPDGVQSRRSRAAAPGAGARTRRRQPDASGQLLGINRDQVRYRIDKFGMKT